MRCFKACFRTDSNHKKIIKPCSSSSNKINSISPKALQDLLQAHENGEACVAIDATNEEAQHDVANTINLIEESKYISSRKNLLENPENGEVSVAINATKEETQHDVSNSINLIEESKNKEEEELNKSNIKKVVTFDLNVSIYDEYNLHKHNEGEEEEANELSNSSVSSYISYDPPNHRNHFYRNNDDEFEDIDLADDANNNNNGDEIIQEESSYESLFSLSIDSRKANPTLEMCDKEEVNSPFKQSIKFNAKDPVNKLSVLNPIIQWKGDAITMAASQLKKKHQEEKENVDMNLLDFSITYNNRVHKEPSLKPQENEIAVDTSLSSWLVESSQDDDNNNMPSLVSQVGSGESSQDDTSNFEKSGGSVGNSPSERTIRFDEKPIILGTVGSYLRHTGQATTLYSNNGISSC